MDLLIKVQENKRAGLVALLSSMGDNIVFDEDKWVCNKLKQSETARENTYTIYFNNIPEEYMEWGKLYALKMVSNRNTIKTIINNITVIF